MVLWGTDSSVVIAEDIFEAACELAAEAVDEVLLIAPCLDEAAEQVLDMAPQSASVAVLTDLSPWGGADHRRQLLAVRQMIDNDLEVRTLSRMHAKCLVVDDRLLLAGSQNFTEFARQSREISVVRPSGPDTGVEAMAEVRRWWSLAIPVDIEMIDRLLEALEAELEELEDARRAALEGYTSIVGEIQRARNRELMARLMAAMELKRSQRHSGPRQTAFPLDRKQFERTSQSNAVVSMEWVDEGYYTLKADAADDLTRWRLGGESTDVLSLRRLNMYPILDLNAGGLTFGRIATTRVTYVRQSVQRHFFGLGRRWDMAVEAMLVPEEDCNLKLQLSCRLATVDLGLVLAGPGSAVIRRSADIQPWVSTDYRFELENWLAELSSGGRTMDGLLRSALSGFKFKKLESDRKNVRDFFTETGRYRVSAASSHGIDFLLSERA